MRGPPPGLVQIAEGIPGEGEVEVPPLEAVDEIKLAAVLVVGVHDLDQRLAEVGQLEEQPLFDLLEIAAGDFVAARILVVGKGEELVLAGEEPRGKNVPQTPP